MPGSTALTSEATTATVAMIYARVIGPKRTKHQTGPTSYIPAFFSGGLVDLATETPQAAAARLIGERWHKIPANANDWEIVLDEDDFPVIRIRWNLVPAFADEAGGCCLWRLGGQVHQPAAEECGDV